MTKNVLKTPEIIFSNNVLLNFSSPLEDPARSIWQPPQLS
jgi:hypothetical protein